MMAKNQGPSINNHQEFSQEAKGYIIVPELNNEAKIKTGTRVWQITQRNKD